MQFRDLQKQYQVLKKDMDAEIQQVLTQANFISGSQVSELEEMLADYVGVKHCVTCANGTDALSLALMVWNIGPGGRRFCAGFHILFYRRGSGCQRGGSDLCGCRRRQL